MATWRRQMIGTRDQRMLLLTFGGIAAALILAFACLRIAIDFDTAPASSTQVVGKRAAQSSTPSAAVSPTATQDGSDTDVDEDDDD